MKTIIGALALFVAAAVAAQTAPAGDPHAGHAQHQQAPGSPTEHEMDCKCCAEMMQHSGKMDCCDEHAKAHADHGSQPAQ